MLLTHIFQLDLHTCKLCYQPYVLVSKLISECTINLHGRPSLSPLVRSSVHKAGFDTLKLLTRTCVCACVCMCVCASVSLKTYKYSPKRASVGCEVGNVSASVVTISVIGCPFGPRH